MAASLPCGIAPAALDNILKKFNESVPQDPQATSSYVKFGKAIGFTDVDWSITPETGRNPQVGKYEAFATAECSESTFLQGVLFSDLATELPEHQKYNVRVNRMSGLFDKQFYCVDEIADSLWFASKNYPPVCEILKIKAGQEAGTFAMPLPIEGSGCLSSVEQNFLLSYLDSLKN